MKEFDPNVSIICKFKIIRYRILMASKLSRLKENIESINIDSSEDVLSEIEKVHNMIPSHSHK